MKSRLVQRRILRLALFAILSLGTGVALLIRMSRGTIQWQSGNHVASSYDWEQRKFKHPFPMSSSTRLPKGTPLTFRIQHDFSKDPVEVARNKTLKWRREAVKRAARRSWQAYRTYAWGMDQLKPVSGSGTNNFGGWGVTLVDSLDTLWIMDMRAEFYEAVRKVGLIDWNKPMTTECSLFETNTRYLGGLLSAYELSHEKVLLGKALELGNMLYAAFDTPNNLPAKAFHFSKAKAGELEAGTREPAASLGSLWLEFTKLSQLTDDPRFFSAVDRIKYEFQMAQNQTNLPGMWPALINLKRGFWTTDESFFTIGALADAAYEYLAKMYLLLGGLDDAYKSMHTTAMDAIHKHLLFRPMLLPEADPQPPPDVLFPGTVVCNGKTIERLPEVQHLGCFAGGMFAIGGRLFDAAEHVTIGEKLARGCAWAYAALPSGIMPDSFELVDCNRPDLGSCEWSEARWEQAREADKVPMHRHAGLDGGGQKAVPTEDGMQQQGQKAKAESAMPNGLVLMRSPAYHLRPEAIESIFVLYRLTGKNDIQDIAWRMFEAIRNATETSNAYSAIHDVGASRGATEKMDAMESFWIAGTLKYFYLVFSEPGLISLDDFVFSTGAHPFRIPKP